jgi:hypothetical protein
MQEPCSISGEEFSHRFERRETGCGDGFFADMYDRFLTRPIPLPKTWADAEKLPLLVPGHRR